MGDLIQEDSDRTIRTVYARNNPELSANGVGFHWWDAGKTSLHNHDYYEFFILTSGRTQYEENGERMELEKKILCLVRPQDCHQFLPIPGESCVHMNLLVVPERLKELCDALEISPDWAKEEGGHRMELSDGDFSFFKWQARELSCEREAGDQPEVVSMVICEMIIHAMVLLHKRRVLARPESPEWLNRVLQWIHSPEHIACSVSEVYRVSGYSAPVVVRAFREYTGETVVGYLTGVRMETAKRMLASSNLTVLDIAGRLGYSSLSHFNRLFRKHAGMTPREYRRESRKQEE